MSYMGSVVPFETLGTGVLHPGSVLTLQQPEAMRMFKCFKQASETKDEMERRSLEYRQEGNVGEVGAVPAGDAPSDATTNQAEIKIKDNPKTIKEKTTLQMAKSAP